MSKPSKAKACPSCGSPASGRFCNECGAPLTGAKCLKCGTELKAGAKFCSNCAQPVGGGAPRPGGASRAPASQPIAWAFAAIAVTSLVIVGVSRMRSTPAAVDVPAPQALFPQTPRGQADLYFDQAMRAGEAGDAATFQSSSQLALAAYRAIELDEDARFHVGLLHSAGSNPDSALAWAEQINAANPRHLFGPMLRAEVARVTGDQELARAAYADFLANYDAEIATDKEEYQAHRTMIDRFAAEARAAP